MPGAKKGEQRESRDACVGIAAGAAAILAENQLLLTGAKLVGVPATVAGLCGDEPIQRGDHGRFSPGVAALPFNEA